MKIRNKFTIVSLSAIVLASVSSLDAAAVIYEPFDDSNATLTGNATGTGFTSSTWTATSTWAVDAGSLAWGDLATSGNRVRTPVGGAMSATVGSALTAPTTGLLDPGETLWFSLIYTTTPGVGSGNPDAGFSLGTAGLSGSNNIPMSSSGNGIGFSLKSGQLQATTWVGGALGRSTANNGGEAVAASTTYFIVGEIIWGADDLVNDTINIYYPNTNLELGTVRATRSAVLDQSGFNTISYAMKNDSVPSFIDEIRFGASYADVSPIPEPSAALLGAFGFLALLRRRK